MNSNNNSTKNMKAVKYLWSKHFWETKVINYWCLRQYRSISKISCWVKEARHKRIHAARFHLFKALKQAKLILRGRNLISGYLWQGAERGYISEEHEWVHHSSLLGVMKILYILIEALVITVYTPVKTHLAVQRVHFVEYKSYLNIFDFF